MARSVKSATLCFGMVSVPIRLFLAASSEAVSFSNLHAKCNGKMQSKRYCPKCDVYVESDDLVKGYEYQKNQYVVFSEEELKSLEAEANASIELTQFVPLSEVDPIFFEKGYYIGVDKGGDRAYRLLANAMSETQRVGVGKCVMNGKENIVLIRFIKPLFAPAGLLMLHTMYFMDEIRSTAEIPSAADAKVTPAETALAKKLVESLSQAFEPEAFQDEYRTRVLNVATAKATGGKLHLVPAAAPAGAKVIDLMDALKKSMEASEEKKKAKKVVPEKPKKKAS